MEIWIIRHLFQGFLLKRELEKYDRSQRSSSRMVFLLFFFFFKMEEVKACLPATEEKNWTKFIESSNLRMRRKYRDHFPHNSIVL